MIDRVTHYRRRSDGREVCRLDAIDQQLDPAHPAFWSMVSGGAMLNNGQQVTAQAMVPLEGQTVEEAFAYLDEHLDRLAREIVTNAVKQAQAQAKRVIIPPTGRLLPTGRK